MKDKDVTDYLKTDLGGCVMTLWPTVADFGRGSV